MDLDLPVSIQDHVNFIWVRCRGQGLLNQVFQPDCHVGDEGIKVNPPYPVIFSLPDESLDNVDLVPVPAAFEVKFQVVPMFIGIPCSRLSGKSKYTE